MAGYHFVTSFRVAATRERAWEVLSDIRAWPSWWRWLRGTCALAEGGPDGVGARRRCWFRTALPYTVTFDAEVVDAAAPRTIELGVSGELTGCGLWELVPAEGGCRLRCTWIVETTPRWMNLLAPVARPVFAWNHHVLMRDFAAGFAARVGVDPPAVDRVQLEPGEAGFGVLVGGGGHMR